MEKNKEDNVVVEQQTTKIETPNRDKLLKGLQKRGSKLADDADYETIIGEAMPKHKELENSYRDMVDNNAIILDAIASNPEVSGLLGELLGVDKDGNSKFVDEVKRRSELIANDRKAQEEWEQNLTKSMLSMEEAFEELEATDELFLSVILLRSLILVLKIYDLAELSKLSMYSLGFSLIFILLKQSCSFNTLNKCSVFLLDIILCLVSKIPSKRGDLPKIFSRSIPPILES